MSSEGIASPFTPQCRASGSWGGRRGQFTHFPFRGPGTRGAGGGLPGLLCGEPAPNSPKDPPCEHPGCARLRLGTAFLFFPFFFHLSLFSSRVRPFFQQTKTNLHKHIHLVPVNLLKMLFSRPAGWRPSGLLFGRHSVPTQCVFPFHVLCGAVSSVPCRGTAPVGVARRERCRVEVLGVFPGMGLCCPGRFPLPLVCVFAWAMYVPRVGVAPSPVCFRGEECGHLPLLPLCVCVSEWYALLPRLGVLLGGALG